MNDYNALERRAGVMTLQGMQSATIHGAMFMQILAAQQAGNEKLAAFYVERFPPDVRKAYDAWLAQKPFGNAQAAAHPFVPELYELRGTREVAEASEKAAPISRNRATPGASPASISPTPSSSPRCSFSPAPRESPSSGACGSSRLPSLPRSSRSPSAAW